VVKSGASSFKRRESRSQHHDMATEMETNLVGLAAICPAAPIHSGDGCEQEEDFEEEEIHVSAPFYRHTPTLASTDVRCDTHETHSCHADAWLVCLPSEVARVSRVPGCEDGSCATDGYIKLLEGRMSSRQGRQWGYTRGEMESNKLREGFEVGFADDGS